MKTHKIIRCLVILQLLLGGWTFSWAQYKTLTRIYDPVVIKGEKISIDDLEIEEWFAYKFDASTGEWTAIPFQMDEVDQAENYQRENDGILDSNDELLFMPDDAMDLASTDQWLNDPVAGNLPRIELEIFDPQNPDQKAWIYLYKNVSNYEEAPGYFDYIPSPDGTGADTIQTCSYKIGHNRKGWTDFMSLSQNWDKDLLDRIKFHANGGGGIVTPFYLTEDAVDFSTENFHKLPIRSFQKVKAKIKLKIGPFPFDEEDTFLMPYLPYSSWISAGFEINQSIAALLTIKNIRLSIDFDPNITGMKFFSAKNVDGFLIDGDPDSIVTELIDLTGINWVMASGTDGTILEFFEFPEIQGATGQNIYYHDDLEGGTNKDTPDTGDLMSFGDMGLWVSGDVLLPESDYLYIAFATYYINETNKDASFAAQLLESIQNPLDVIATQQSRTTSVTAAPNPIPTELVLYDTYPNPYNAKLGDIRFSMRLGTNKQNAVLRIFNIIGQEVMHFQISHGIGQNGPIEFQWNGRSADGQPLPSGVYFYKLKAGVKNVTKKFILLQ